MTIYKDMLKAAEKLRKKVNKIAFSEPVTHVYNPLDYAWESYSRYHQLYGDNKKKIIFMGMNPGPWGMAQTGVPFGEIDAVKNWLEIDAPIDKPAKEHPKRPVTGFQCSRSEVSGRRLWGFFKERFGTPEDFFKEHFVANYCPLVFMEESGRNRTPDKLKKDERQLLFDVCDDHIRDMIKIMAPEWMIGVGRFALLRIQTVLEAEAGLKKRVKVATILHPSPASPAANRDWAGMVTGQLQACGITL